MAEEEGRGTVMTPELSWLLFEADFRFTVRRHALRVAVLCDKDYPLTINMFRATAQELGVSEEKLMEYVEKDIEGSGMSPFNYSLYASRRAEAKESKEKDIATDNP